MKTKPRTYQATMITMIAIVLGAIVPLKVHCLSPNWQIEEVQQMWVSGGGPLGFDQNNNPLIVYPERPRGALRLAYRENGVWNFVDIDEFPSSFSYAGLPSPTLAIDPSGHWGMSYCVEEEADILRGALKYASGAGLTFEKETILEDWRKGVHSETSLKFSPSGEPAIAFLAGIYNELGVMVAEELLLAWQRGGTWETEVVLNTSTSPLLGVEITFYSFTGAPSLTFTHQGDPAIACRSQYFKGSSQMVSSLDLFRYSTAPGEGWSMEAIVSTTEDDLRYHSPCLTCDLQGDLCVSYVQSSGVIDKDDTVKLAVYDGDSWDIRTVEHPDQVGVYDTFLVFGEDNEPYLCYGFEKVDPESLSVYNAVRFATERNSEWEIETVQGGEGVDGAFPYGMALDRNGVPCISYTRNCIVTYARYQEGDSVDGGDTGGEGGEGGGGCFISLINSNL
jgi:hypothetical protein